METHITSDEARGAMEPRHLGYILAIPSTAAVIDVAVAWALVP